MSYSKRLTLSLSFLIAFSGCVSVKSNVDPEFKQRVESVFVVARNHSSIDSFVAALTQSVASELAQRGVRVEYHVVDPLSLDPGQALEEEIGTFDPDAVLMIVPTERGTLDGLNKSVTMDFSLVPPGADRIAWRAQVRTEGMGFGDLGSTQGIARKAVNQMLADGIQLGTPVAATR